MKTYEFIAVHLIAMRNCQKINNFEWEERHSDSLDKILSTFPDSSGFNSGTELDYEKSTSDKLIFNSAYHFMNENGMYDGYNNFRIVVPIIYRRI